MRLAERNPPRVFEPAPGIAISDCGDVELRPDEQVTLVTEAGKRMDVAARDFGFYATPSVNGRLKSEGFKTALVRNARGQVYVMVVDSDRMADFDRYCASERQTVLEWLDERPLD
ncbi:hypothetical protein [Minwuia thermotolerans]|uniref:hypothetical protein n=1 Tax=Minwuia thermotolerans TaxID=2056226 RepID=UPI0013DE765B|nr:hypothetical protein [Minwuia thermotolerans]